MNIWPNCVRNRSILITWWLCHFIDLPLDFSALPFGFLCSHIMKVWILPVWCQQLRMGVGPQMVWRWFGLLGANWSSFKLRCWPDGWSWISMSHHLSPAFSLLDSNNLQVSAQQTFWPLGKWRNQTSEEHFQLPPWIWDTKSLNKSVQSASSQVDLEHLTSPLCLLWSNNMQNNLAWCFWT